jgi:hypothetical protein
VEQSNSCEEDFAYGQGFQMIHWSGLDLGSDGGREWAAAAVEEAAVHCRFAFLANQRLVLSAQGSGSDRSRLWGTAAVVWWFSTVDLTAMADPHHQDQEFAALPFADNPELAHS